MQKADGAPSPGETAAAACHEPFADAWTRLESEQGQPVVAALRAATARHAELITELGLERDPPASWTERAEQLLEYRRSVDTDMLDPLRDAFEKASPTVAIERAVASAFDLALTRCRELRSTTTAPWPEAALERQPSDRFGRRVGKVFARLFSKARKTGRERTLPLRNVALEHLARVVVPAEDASAVAALATWAEWTSRLERAWIEWGRAALHPLVDAELPNEEAEEATAVWTSVREAAKALQTALAQLLADEPSDESCEAAHARLEVARGVLEADLAVAGSFLLNPPAAPAVTAPRRLAYVAPALREWDQGVNARLQLYLSLLSILSGATAVQRRMVWRFRERCLKDMHGLSAVASELERLDTELTSAGATASLAERIAGLDAKVKATLEPAHGVIPSHVLVEKSIREISESTIEALSAMIRQAPAALALHSPHAKPPSGGRRVESRSLAFQELARQSFDALRIERIRSSMSGLLDALDVIRKKVGELEGVYTFARDEARRELESKEPEAPARALDLVSGALRSTAEALRAQGTSLDAALTSAHDRLASELSEGSTALLDRLGAGRMEARLFAARSRFTALRAWLNETWGPPFERASRWLKIRWGRLRRLTQRVLRKGSAIVGSGAATTEASARSLAVLTNTQALTERLPLVYQRLFTLDPISDPALMSGREAELADAMKRWKRWHDADGVPLIVKGRQGSGISSFMNVFGAEIERAGGKVAYSALHERITDEAGLAAHLAGPLGLPPTDSMDQLARSIFEVDPHSLPATVVLDNLEHLYLRVPKGTDLIERLLTLMSETEPRVFWIGGINVSAWQLVRAAEPTAVTQVDVIELQPLSASAMRSAIMARHKRSGLAIRYEEPTSGRHLLRRKLRKISDADGYQEAVEDDFFDQLHRASGGSVSLALYGWLLSADFQSGDGVLMKSPTRPDFSVLETLDLTQNFTLKAFLEHRSLTLEEHDRIFRLPRHESYQIFESLRNRHLLEPLPLPGQEDAEARSEIEEALRYEVHPLLTGAVIAHLQARNIVH